MPPRSGPKEKIHLNNKLNIKKKAMGIALSRASIKCSFGVYFFFEFQFWQTSRQFKELLLGAVGARIDLLSFGENYFDLAPLWDPLAPPKGRKNRDFSDGSTLKWNHSKSDDPIWIKLLVNVVLNKGYKSYSSFFEKKHFYPEKITLEKNYEFFFR